MQTQPRLQTPHSGYHWNGITKSYFEGWYFRVTLPEIAQTFAFMYSIEDPIGRQANSGGAVQILGIDEAYLSRTFPDVQQFWASRNSLELKHWKNPENNQPAKSSSPIPHPSSLIPYPSSLIPHPSSFNEGYQVTANLNQGCIYDPRNQQYCRWEYQIQPLYGWGNPNLTQQATAGWLSYLPVFDPGWQILMAHGLATGWIEWQGTKYQFTEAPAYSEKNWGTSFPKKWFWINCNSFTDQYNLALTAAGGVRQVLWGEESVGMIGIHFQGYFVEFVPENSQITWQVKPWGEWLMQATKEDLVVTLIGTTDLPGTYVRTPTAQGLVLNCRDTTQGKLLLKLQYKGKTIVEANSSLAGLEVGGAPWHETFSQD
ncbi:hypothetical protein Xen7305DRAFT_00032110 [Xenococcus sp. PCC 7305]|uniref:tocopherol cyclase family protein n=1 Tax=Xenococcus sp. PCC 7305 TaxID=102125 RepID=UPI0002AC5545|nr:tocopherol cyclase family protein [Xenococcus sp. PCC 7305]ELS03487.1 hypothetical protein Xen7305DRAFT_00032110 [Xenococcus sp. PCC 7305]